MRAGIGMAGAVRVGARSDVGHVVARWRGGVVSSGGDGGDDVVRACMRVCVVVWSYKLRETGDGEDDEDGDGRSDLFDGE